MSISKEAFAAVIRTGLDEGMPGTAPAVFGEASTFIAMLSMAGTRKQAGDAEADPRLR